MKYLKVLLLCLLMLLVSCKESETTAVNETTNDVETDYILTQSFLDIHPEELEISKNFEEIVLADVRSNLEEIEGEVKIAVIYPGLQASDYWSRSVASFTSRLDELEIKYDLLEYFTHAGTDIVIQENQIKEALENNPDYMIFTLDAKAHQRIIEQIINQKKTKLILQNITTPYRIWEGNQPLMYVGFDHQIGSELIADEYIKRFDGKGKYGVLYFTEGYVSEMRGDTFISYLNDNSEFELVESYYTDGNREKAKQATLDLLKLHPDIKFIYACSTDVSLGAIDALKEQGLIGSILVNGWGGGSAELESITNKEMSLTVMRMNDDNGVAMAEAIYMDKLNEKIPTIFSGSFAIVDQDTSKDELNHLKVRAFRYSD